MIQASMGPLSQLMNLQERISTNKGHDVHFVRIEAVGDEPVHGPQEQVFAFALYEIDGPTSKKYPEKRQYALAIMKARPSGRRYEWWVESVVFPYTPQSYSAPDKAVGDGHAH